MGKAKSIIDVPSGHRLIGIIGRPGSGADALLQRFLENHPDSGPVLGFTTEAKRTHNRNGLDLYISETDLADCERTGQVIWSRKTGGYESGMLVDHLRQAIWMHTYSLMVMPLDAVPIIYSVLPPDCQQYFYISHREEELRRRLKQRNGSNEAARRILESSKYWTRRAVWFEDEGWPITILTEPELNFLYQEFLAELGIPAY